jgi:hypothetical protein
MLFRMRVTLLFVLLWGLLLVPALCTAGELVHPCECGETIQCEHEEECVEDPCADQAVVVQSDPDFVDPAPVVVVHPLAAPSPTVIPVPPGTDDPSPPEPAFPAGSHPLRN